MIRIIGCSLCSITEHEGRIIQSRSEDSIINEIEAIRDTVPGFTGVISDLGGPTANMYMLRCKSRARSKPAAVSPVSIQAFANIWTPTTSRRSTSIAARVI